MRFLHCADIHLGRQPYFLDARFDDFARVFVHLCERAVELRVDAFLIGGDLFDKRNINAATLTHATQALSILRDAGIPTVAIEGNHDKAFRYDRSSWMEYLASAGFLRLLKPEYEGGHLHLGEWDETTKRGAWTEIGGARFYGLGYPGAATETVLKAALSLFPENPDRYTVMLLHAGVGLPDIGMGLGSTSWETLTLFRGRVHFVALGHWHKPMRREVEGNPSFVAVMPSSPEICDIGEASYDHGFYLVETSTDPNLPPALTFEPTPRRAHFHQVIRVDGCDSMDALRERLMERLEWSRLRALELPIVELVLTGNLPFDPMDVDTNVLRQSLVREHPCLHVDILNNANLPPSVIQASDFGDGQASVERDALMELASESLEYAPFAELLVELCQDWKSRALDAAEDLTPDIHAMLFRTLDQMREQGEPESPPSASPAETVPIPDSATPDAPQPSPIVPRTGLTLFDIAEDTAENLSPKTQI